ncbi:MAG TPA: hypothetical protein H9931_12060 [Candidatus Enterocloster excrementigallinarum]|uniref:Uncharacterized protein n=1 Tax=Candidatus Enterocloster excrementigallinarum TaxID=2838558 RepID=A0A9D2PUJ9_9FIRM|nr:hypothetical protein [Candidatus Enterocloster excrementigallinarum]
MNKWIESRIKELTEQKRDELTEYFEDYMWHDAFGESKIDELSLYYNEQYIPSKIETLENNDWNEIFVKALYEINSKYPFDNFWSHTDEIEKDYPKYINDIMGFFDSIQNKYNEDLNQAHDNALEGYVAYHLEQEAERIQEQAEEEYDELEGDEMD